MERVVLPIVDAHSHDEVLRDDWLRSADTWLSESRQVAYLIALVRDLGPLEQLPRLRVVLRELVASGDREAKELARKGLLD